MSNNLALFTDLYELTMAQAYLEEGMDEEAVFSLFVRRLPEQRPFLLACGLESVLEYLETLHFSEEDIDYLASLDRFSERFLDWLRQFRFTGNVYALPEGTPVFANEPILEIVAPLPEAQIVETFVMNQVHLQTLLCSKGQRVSASAAGRPVIDFGSRRTHGTDAAVKAARAFYIGGLAATSNLLAGMRYGVPVSGTMAHSYIQAHEDEWEAFRAFARLYPETVLLVDTYDTLTGVRRVIELMQSSEVAISAVRLDSGDLLELSKGARALLDEAGFHKVQIVASGGLDEHEIARLIASGAPIDAFGVGTSLGVSQDAPDLDIAYKLCEYAGEGRLKLSPGKPILPGRKQVFRMSESGRYRQDLIACAHEPLTGEALLKPVMENGARLKAPAPLASIRADSQAQIDRLPEALKAIDGAPTDYDVQVSDELSAYRRRVEAHVRTA